MKAGHVFAFFLASCMFVAVPAAHADEVTLENGDRLVGRVVNQSGNLLTLETDYAGRVKIKWSAVASISTDAPVEVILAGEERIERAALGAAAPGEDGGRRAELRGAGRIVSLDRVAYINPTPEESGIGTTSSGRLNVSAARTGGNSSGARSYGDADYTVRAKLYRWSLGGKANRASEAGLQTASNWRAGGNFDWFVDKSRFVYLRSSAEHDVFKDLDLRGALGGGYGVQVVEDKQTNVSLRGGVDYVVVDRIAGPTERYPALGWGFKATHKFDRLGAELFHDDDGFWNLRQRGEVSVRSRTGLRVPLADGVTATLQVNLDWDRNPAEGRKPTDTTVLLGLGYAF